MTTQFEDEPADFGEFDYKVKVFKRYVNVSNPKLEKLENGKPCTCWVPITNNYKSFSEVSLRVLATNMYGADLFQTLLELKDATKETGKRATDAKAALTDLAPTGKTWQQYAEMINNVYEQNKETYKAKLSENHIWLLNGLRDDFAAAGLNGKLDKAKLEELASDIKTVRGFTRLVFNAKFCAETEEYIDPTTNQTKKRYTTAAKHGQQILGGLAADGKWKTLYNDVFDVELAKRKTYFDLIEKLNKQEDQNARLTSSINLSDVDLASLRQAQLETPVADQQTASALLNQRSVVMAANDDVFVLPPEVKQALSMVKKSAAIAA